MNLKRLALSRHLLALWTFGGTLFIGARALGENFPALTLGPAGTPLLEWRSNGLLVSKGTWGSGSDFLSGDFDSGGSLLWNPNNGVFRAGYNYPWVSRGVLSAGFGAGIPIGFASFAAGYGWGNGDYSAAFGVSGAGPYSLSAGNSTGALGESTFAVGYMSQAFKFGSSALGVSTQANGIASTALGVSTNAGPYASVAIGRFNVGTYSANGNLDWKPEDPVFEIGNGTDAGHTSNVFTVYKDGKIRMKKQGDIRMGQFGLDGD